MQPVNPKQHQALLRQRREAQERQIRIFKALEPQLKQRLFDRMMSQEPIKVLRPFRIISERLQKGGGGSTGRFEQGAELIPMGVELVFEMRDKSVNQFIFKSFKKGQEGPEYGIYESPVIVNFRNEATPNPGYYGLLMNTDVWAELLNELQEQSDG